jgi:stage V sporulation protein G
MKITEVKVFPVRDEKKDKRLRAYVTIVFEDCFIVRDLKVIIGNDGNLFVSMPSRRSKYGSFRDIAHPLNSTMRSEIEQAVFAEYEKISKTAEFNEPMNSYDME